VVVVVDDNVIVSVVVGAVNEINVASSFGAAIATNRRRRR
jgi:hypothetical protein